MRDGVSTLCRESPRRAGAAAANIWLLSLEVEKAAAARIAAAAGKLLQVLQYCV
jgi:hypothetical protein